MCEQCAHKTHLGLCGVYVEVQHVEIECACFQASVLDIKILRQRDAEQSRRLDELKRKTEGKTERKTSPRPKYRRF